MGLSLIFNILIAVLVGLVISWYLAKKSKQARLNVLIKKRKAEQHWNFNWAQNSFNTLDENRAKQITSLDFHALQNGLQSGEIGPLEALKAYQRAAYEAHLKTNCICLFIPQAVDIANELEARRAADPDFQKPPLFGIPVSIKESIHVKNMDSTLGYSQFLEEPEKENSSSVEQLIRLGAIPFVHTNIPQALLSFGCCNPIYGSTSNPFDPSRVPGGSSGGEAALIASGGSPLGIGTDVGGSVRTPATFCGLAGFKSSSDRCRHLGKVATIPGRQMIRSVEGPIAPTIDVCVDYLRLKWNDFTLYEKDIYTPPVPFQENLYNSESKLRIGYYTFDGYQEAAPAYKRAVLDTVKILEEEGHHIEEFQVPRPVHMFSIFVAGATADGGLYLNRSLENDIIPPECNIGFPVTRLPHFLQRILRKYVPNERMRSLLQELPHDCEEMREMHEKIEDYRHEFVVAMRAQKLDAIVCPAFGTLPPRHGTPNKMISASSYTALFNLLDFAAGTVPVSSVSAKDDLDADNMSCADNWDELVKNESQNCRGLPISVQIAAPPYREEICLRLLKNIESRIGLRRI